VPGDVGRGRTAAEEPNTGASVLVASLGASEFGHPTFFEIRDSFPFARVTRNPAGVTFCDDRVPLSEASASLSGAKGTLWLLLYPEVSVRTCERQALKSSPAFRILRYSGDPRH